MILLIIFPRAHVIDMIENNYYMLAMHINRRENKNIKKINQWYMVNNNH